jgi:hypothetical protein
MFTRRELRFVKWAIYSKLKDIDDRIETCNNAVDLRDLAEDLAEYEELYAKVTELINKEM